MPKVGNYSGYRFFIFSNDHSFPRHCHVEKSGIEMKISWEVGQNGLLIFTTKFMTRAKFSESQLGKIRGIVRDNRVQLETQIDRFLVAGEKPNFVKKKKNKSRKSKSHDAPQ